MARATGSVCKVCRREGLKLFFKGERCYTDKCAYERRPYPPGVHGQGRAKVTDYGVRLREKQRVRKSYGMLERQFRRFYQNALRKKGVTGDYLFELLERRLDNVLFRLGFSKTRAQGRQFVRHGHILVNQRKVSVPSYLVRTGDVITIREGSRSIPAWAEALEFSTRKTLPDWLECDREKWIGRIRELPRREHVGETFKEQYVVEFYSR
ncbi:MAG: 30S ribosomal protein S4 [Nitrospirae bacterium]|nr:30S ribosomal protein S4 [Nitrospirota bacterium]